MDYKKGGGLILSSERAQLVDGLWTIQKYGDFAPGDKRLARVFVTGRVEMRQLGGLFKLSFDGLAVQRLADNPSQSPLKAKVFLTRKKAKKRMADLEETGYSVPISRDLDKNGFVCSGDATLGTFDFQITLSDCRCTLESALLSAFLIFSLISSWKYLQTLHA